VIYPIAKVGGGTAEGGRQSVCCRRERRPRAAVSDGDPSASLRAPRGREFKSRRERREITRGNFTLHAEGVSGRGFRHLDEKSGGDWRKEVERESKQMELYVQPRMLQKHLENWPD